MNQEELEKRTLEFSKNLIKTVQQLPNNQVNYKIGGQVIDSGTSIGANYREANAAESSKDFKHKINISFKEAKETRYWLDLLIFANSNNIDDLSPLRQESDEFTRIFGKIVYSCKQNEKCKMKNVK
jgi:four helix bundle protein